MENTHAVHTIYLQVTPEYCHCVGVNLVKETKKAYQFRTDINGFLLWFPKSAMKIEQDKSNGLEATSYFFKKWFVPKLSRGQLHKLNSSSECHTI